MNNSSELHSSWMKYLKAEFEQPYMQILADFLQKEKAAFNATPFNKVRVVILGQDPYHGPGQAHGLSFSVPSGIDIPPSLKNIYKELNRSLGLSTPQTGCLQAWADQGVMLLNATLTVEASKAGSHQNKGWERFTDAVIDVLNQHYNGLVFLLWGAYAQKKAKGVDVNKHKVLCSAHPSPLSAYRGFFGNQHFVLTNQYLKSQGLKEIDWFVR